MPPSRRERSPARPVERPVFVPPTLPANRYSLDKVVPVTLPGITTRLAQIPDPIPESLPPEAIGRTHTNHQRIISLLKGINPNLITGKRARRKDPHGENYYQVEQLRTIASIFGLKPSKKDKAELKVSVLDTYSKFKSSDRPPVEG
jgi:hypothetical protein